jgi:RNA polymerase sigma factor (TIGR02999 family)
LICDFRGAMARNRPASLMELSPSGRLWATAVAVARYLWELGYRGSEWLQMVALRGDMSEVTRILMAIERGDGRAIDQLLPAVYQELRQLAAQRLSREKPGQTLQATALVHEAYLRLVGVEGQTWKSKTHFFATAAEAMRRILVENARRKRRVKRGKDYQRVDLDQAEITLESPAEDLLAVDEALAGLEAVDKTKANLVKLHYFAGLTMEQAAELLGISERTAKRYWSYTRAWLYDRMGPTS